MLKIDLKEITIGEIVESYLDSGVDGIKGYHGKLDIRPPYQREFIYTGAQREAVIDTILKGFPLNVMYWCKKNDDTYEILDGQQRTISFCQFCANEFMITYKGILRTWDSMPQEDKNKILHYKCMIYICSGTESEKLDWFKVINTAGVKLTDQELRNACYTGPWLVDAKLKFSKPSCPAYNMGSKLLTGSPIRQEFLETALKWISEYKNMGSIEEYMLQHQTDHNALELWNYYSNVINWVNATFIKYRSQMKGVDWGKLYNKYSGNLYNPTELELKISKLMMDDEVENKKGIYEYVFDGLERHLNLRVFTESEKTTMYERQHGICPLCNNRFDYSQMQGDHITPWSQGGKTTLDNGQMLCADCNRRKSSR
jgi:hypothetical protein